MKKWMYILLGIVALGVVLYLSVDINTNTGCPPPEKPNGVPQSAAWVGGCDGGNWIELVSIEKEKVRFRIYRDWNGDLILDADFEYQGCDEFRLTKSNWEEYVAYFGSAIELMNKSGVNDRCRLEPVYPAYEEESIE